MKVLIADDDETLRTELAELLQQGGHEASVAADGKETMQRLEGEPFDVVLMDWRMPGAAGSDLLRRVKEVRPETAIIVMTGYGSVDTAVKALKSGAVDFIEKPFEIQSIERAFQHTRKAARESQRKFRREVSLKERHQVSGRPRVAGSEDIKAAFLNYTNGTLVAHKIRSGEKTIDEDILAATLDVISNFMRTSFPMLQGKRLRSISQGDHTLVIERGKNVYLTLVIRGEESEAMRRRMRARIRDFESQNREALEHWNGDPDEVGGLDDLLSAFIPTG